MVENDARAVRGDALVGNRLALAGAVMYLLEWVAIIAASPPGPLGPGTGTSEVFDAYAGHAGAAAVSATWFAVFLVGRVLFMCGLKASLRERPRAVPLLDLAVAAMAISVALEIAAYSVVAAAARLATDGARSDVVGALDGVGYWLNLAIFGPIGVSILSAAAAMFRSRLFRAWLCWLALVAGAAALVGCVLTGFTADKGGAGLSDSVTSVAALGMWIWMIATGVGLWRRS